jgi:hypothetical protein
MRVAERLPSLLVVPETWMVAPVVISASAPSTLFVTVVFGAIRTRRELPSRVLSVMLLASFAATSYIGVPYGISKRPVLCRSFLLCE